MDNLKEKIEKLIKDANNLSYESSYNHKLNTIKIEVISFIRDNFRDNVCDYEDQFNKIKFRSNYSSTTSDYVKAFESGKNMLITLLGVIESNISNSYYSNLSEENNKLRLENAELKKTRKLKLAEIIGIIGIILASYTLVYTIGYNIGEKKEFKIEKVDKLHHTPKK